LPTTPAPLKTPLFARSVVLYDILHAFLNRHRSRTDLWQGMILSERMLMYRLITLLPMLALLIFAAAQDLRTRRIRNWLTLCLVLTGIAHSLVSPHSISLSESLLGMCGGFAFALVLFLIGAMGGGDLKLLAGIGAWLGPSGFVQVYVAASIIGMVIVLAQCAVKGRLKILVGNTYVLVMNFLHVGELGVQQVIETGKRCRSVDRPLPYAVPVLLAVLLMVAMN
jgi:prepilin peptidase CpaA